MLKEFRDFAMRGNVLDLAVGIIIGAAFTSVVNSLVNDIIMPPIGYIMNGIDFSNFFLVLKGDDYASLKGRNAIEDVNPDTGEAESSTPVPAPSTPAETPKNG